VYSIDSTKTESFVRSVKFETSFWNCIWNCILK
jgi:hypothetical protein